MKKLIKAVLLLLVLSVCIVLAVSVWLIKTESGLQWALKQAPSNIAVSKVKGTLSDLTFEGLTLTLDGSEISVNSGTVKVSIRDFLSKRARVKFLSVDNIEIRLVGSQRPNDERIYRPWQGLNLPIDLAFEKIAIKNFRVVRDKPLIILDEINAALQINNNLLGLSQFEIIQAENTARIHGTLDLSAKDGGLVDLEHDAHWRFGDQNLIGNGSIKGKWHSLTISNASELPVKTDLILNLKNVLSDNITWDGTLSTDDEAYKHDESSSLVLDAGMLDIIGSFSPSKGLAGLASKVSGKLSGGYSELSNFQLHTDISLANDSLDVAKLELTEIQRAQTDTAVPNSAENTKLDSASTGSLLISGSIRELKQFLRGDTDTNTGTEEKSNNANADLKGVWQNLTWPLGQEKKQITTNGDFSLKGTPDDFQITATGDGYSFGTPFDAIADIHVIARVPELKRFSLQSGKSQATIVGKIGEYLDLKWNIDSPDLSEFLPSLGGDLQTKGALSGALSSPTINASLGSSEFIFGNIKLQGIAVNTLGSLIETSAPLEIKASINKVNQAGAKVASDIDLTITGSGRAHSLLAKAQLFDQSTLAVAAKGGLIEDGWQGSLTTLDFSDPSYDKWSLAEPINIRRAGAKLSADRACLNNQNQRLCLAMISTRRGLTASGEIQRLALNNFNPLLALFDVSLSGLLNGKFSYSKNANQEIAKISAELNAQNAVLSSQYDNRTPQVLKIKSVDVNIEQQQSLTSKAALILENDDLISASINVASGIESADFMSAKLEGIASANITDLSRLQATTAALEGLSGSLNTKVNFGGSIANPMIGMRTTLANGGLELSELGLALSEIDLQATSLNKQNIEVNGKLKSGEGMLKLNGNLDFAKLNSPRAELTLKGDNVALMNTAEIQIDGNIDSTIAISKELVNIDGTFDVVQADLGFQLPENAILASNDVVLLGEAGAQIRTRQKINLNINLGDKTRIRAQGLDANLVGKLQVLQSPGGILRAAGQVDIKDGRYAAYNQKLEIDKGQLIYNGGAIDDPSLLLRAQKKVDNITAGVSVSGRASSPILKLYSTPSMSDQDVLSVLLFGKPVGDLASQDGLTLLRIANSLRGDGTEKSTVDTLTENIQDTLGLSNLELQLEGNSPSLVAGKQVSSKFYIGYGYGLLDTAQSLVLRYKINQAWSIQGDVGADSGADLRYQIER